MFAVSQWLQLKAPLESGSYYSEINPLNITINVRVTYIGPFCGTLMVLATNTYTFCDKHQ